jgi:hypothetical protein
VPSPAHELAVLVLAEQPELLALLLRKGARVELAAPLVRQDSAVRLAQAVEVRPDLLFEREGGAAIALEVQSEEDAGKVRRWAVLMSVLHDTTGAMGDLVVLTSSRRVARWARRACHVRGPLGTRSTLTPIVILISGEVLDAMLDPDHPELAFFAAWAMQRRHGPAARQMVRRALSLTEALPPGLRQAQRRAIFQVLSERMLAFLEEVAMDASKIPESPRAREVREAHDAYLERSIERMDPILRARLEAEGEAKGEMRGEARALIVLLEARGLPISADERAKLYACADRATLDRWMRQAVVADSTAAALR